MDGLLAHYWEREKLDNENHGHGQEQICQTTANNSNNFESPFDAAWKFVP